MTPQPIDINSLTDSQIDRIYEQIVEWKWTGILIEGSPTIRFNKKRYLVRRLIYSLHHADPGTKIVDHKCNSKRCLNPICMFLR